MKLQSIKDLFDQSLSEHYTYQEIDTIFYILAEKYLHKNKSILRSSLHEEWSETATSALLFRAALEQLKAGKPYQYVVGETQFMEHRIFVNEKVLIPRPETEELVEWIVQDFTHPHKEFNGNILDVGTGSGAIAIALKNKFPNAIVHALDISPEALKQAQINADYNQTPIHFHLIDFLNSELDDLPHFDIIVSNPPYIPESEQDEMQSQVVDFEPKEALFVPDENPLLFYKQLSYTAQDRLKNDGTLYVEIHQNLKDSTEKLYEYGFAKVESRKDISGNWRMVKARQPYTCK